MNIDSSNHPEETQDKYLTGSIDEFDSMWSNLPDDFRFHFKRGTPENQIQYAFQNHWRVFKNIIRDLNGGKALEVGCGRGSMAAFFADDNHETHLLDTSYSALKLAEVNFVKDNLLGMPVVGDALKLPYRNASFDVIYSIGLFEHFSEIESPLKEQIRVLKKGGYFLGYVVPERWFSAQLLGIPVNFLLEIEYLLTNRVKIKSSFANFKEELFRNKFSAKEYIELLEAMGVQEAGYYGIFPVPMISHSCKFPFTLLSPKREKMLVRFWDYVLNLRFWRDDPWVCAEKWGLAFLIWAKK